MYDIFSLPDFKFSNDFFWGSATAGHQIEGNNIHSDRWYIEQEEKKQEPWRDLSGDACNSYNMYCEDISLLKELKHQVYRMSIEWSRIEPENGVFDEAALKHYIDVLQKLKEAGIKVFVTLVHLSVPHWFRKEGYFYNIANIKYFTRYIDYLVPKISQYVDYWNVINEFNLVLNTDTNGTCFKLNSLKYHAVGYHTIKKYSNAPISSSHAFIPYVPLRAYDKYDKIMTDFCDFRDHEFFFHAIRTGEVIFPFTDGFIDNDIKGTADFWSVNNYTRNMIDARNCWAAGKRYDHKILKMIDMDFYLEEMFPEGIIGVTQRLSDKPTIISENGCSCDDDRFRIIYLATYLSAINEANKLGANVVGYLYWSLLDNYEWGSYRPKFGLVEVNRETFERKPKPSAYFYREIIENNGFNQQILRKYLDENPSLIKIK